ncbi:Dihydrolipoyllysine-residue acetyltransferase component of pyruvate dehydrogenase complex [Sedimentisphaera cyanobacteriorum]|uniref:Dihydrolipoyllysine-residue acetyltransferase component of pyruvate dehydrogenase complex n=1 Tax=Sedimentisphaera cyanobacteriorum TaxID=1940790 RepID=A0A1Q2HS80_9BACT|nr:2-oxo acid dehydrogenase subunit E2 [Sedimentisphaera cyanobacteriorum]AQQ10318.1 Dihydrolipoyllysine-residue acetyltransferase component of pyruvate dehydrogenase complex [Sedimentisphaera cyanobacteriorum]
MEKRAPLTRIQNLIGQRMLHSKRTIPSHYINKTVRTNALNRFRRDYAKSSGVRISTNDIFFAAAARAAEAFPFMLSRVEGEKIRIADTIDISFAVASRSGILFVPVIRAVELLSLAQIAEISEDLTRRGREDKLSPEEMNNASIALSSLGMYGINSFVAIPPADSNAIISVGRPESELVLKEGKPIGEKRMNFCLSVNAKTVSPFYAAKYLAKFSEFLENPVKLAD